MSSQVEQRIKKAQTELATAISERDQERQRKKFKCCCGDMHAIGDCTVVQTYWYTKPYGCTGGDYWNQGELRVVCPYTWTRNRILFRSQYEIPWPTRDEFEYNAEAQFKHMYKSLFKNIVEDHNEDKHEWVNNYYFDENHAKFGIKIKPIV